jgi:hypothetical protein
MLFVSLLFCLLSLAESQSCDSNAILTAISNVVLQPPYGPGEQRTWMIGQRDAQCLNSTTDNSCMKALVGQMMAGNPTVGMGCTPMIMSALQNSMIPTDASVTECCNKIASTGNSYCDLAAIPAAQGIAMIDQSTTTLDTVALDAVCNLLDSACDNSMYNLQCGKDSNGDYCFNTFLDWSGQALNLTLDSMGPGYLINNAVAKDSNVCNAPCWSVLSEFVTKVDITMQASGSMTMGCLSDGAAGSCWPVMGTLNEIEANSGTVTPQHVLQICSAGTCKASIIAATQAVKATLSGQQLADANTLIQLLQGITCPSAAPVAPPVDPPTAAPVVSPTAPSSPTAAPTAAPPTSPTSPTSPTLPPNASGSSSLKFSLSVAVMSIYQIFQLL